MAGRLRSAPPRLQPSRRAKVVVPPKVAADFYRSAEWRALIARLVAERGRRCEDPDHEGGRERSGMRVYGDHVVELADGGAPLDAANVMLRCAACHGRKTAAARALRLHGGGG